MADYVIDGKIGIDLTATYASTSAGSTSVFPVTVGTVVSTTNNGRYVFARAQSTIAAYDVVVFSTYADSASLTPILRCVPAETTNAVIGGTVGPSMLGVAQNAITSGTYGWIGLNGMLRTSLLIGCNPKVPLFLTATAGKLDDATVSSAFVQGIIANTSATSASAPYCIVNNMGLVVSNPL